LGFTVQQSGHTTLQTVNLRHPCFQCRWSSLLERFTGLIKVIRPLSFNCFRQQLKHFYFVNIDTSPSTTVEH